MKDKKNILSEHAEQNSLIQLIPRNTGITLDLDKIQAIIGPRRVGKTSAMFLTMRELKQ